MPGVSPSSLRLWDDNPTATDLLGFDAVVSPILEALATPDLDPLTIGIHSPWGGGKSTVLRLLDDRLLEEENRYLVISVDPWKFDDHLDVRGTLMSEILDELLLSYDAVVGVKESVVALRKRIGWGRMAATLGSGGVTMQWDPDNLIKAFTPKDRKSTESMSGFREQFEELVGKLTEVERVVVLVDDLDRCLPEAVMATLEAIKLFLSVPKMVFVLAADQAMVRDAIAASLSKTSRSEAFADRYLEKIIQLPVVLPRLAPHDAEAYIVLLLAGQHLPENDTDAFDELVAHCAGRRQAGDTALLAGVDGLRWKPESEVLQLAGQLAQGLLADRLSNPRKIKRFLNAFGVRASIVEARNITVSPAVLVKMLLLEEQYAPSFETLAGASGPERRDLLESWEAWARGDGSGPPTGVEPATKEWARSAPSLAEENLDPYLLLAASLLNVGVGGQVSDAVVELVRSLLTGGEAAQAAAVKQLAGLSASEQAGAMELMFTMAGRMDDAEKMFTAIADWTKVTPSLAAQAAAGVRANLNRMTPGAVVDLKLSGVPELIALLSVIAADGSVDQMVRDTATGEMER